MGDSAAFTIVQNEPAFLPLWLAYYTRYFAPEDLYVLDHDSCDGSPQGARRRFGAQLVPVHRDRSFDHRWLCETVGRFQAFLLQSYRAVLFAEADEIVVADPRAFRGLDEYVGALQAPYARCLGLNVLHRHRDEPPLDFARPVLAQRSTCYLSGMYCKPLLAREPLAWEPGFHTARGADAAPDGRLYLLHLHRVDYATCLRRHQASARRRWNEADVREGMGVQNRVCDPAEFDRWFYGGRDLGEERHDIPAHLRPVF